MLSATKGAACGQDQWPHHRRILDWVLSQLLVQILSSSRSRACRTIPWTYLAALAVAALGRIVPVRAAVTPPRAAPPSMTAGSERQSRQRARTVRSCGPYLFAER